MHCTQYISDNGLTWILNTYLRYAVCMHNDDNVLNCEQLFLLMRTCQLSEG